MRWAIIPVFSLILVSGCANQYGNISGKFYSPRIERELNYYVATHPLYSTNHFYVGAFTLQGTNMDDGMVYWKEENELLPYSELRPDAPDDIIAWRGKSLKLGRDTVDSEADLNGSTYLLTAANWNNWVHQCLCKGKPYVISLTDARRAFPNEETLDDY